LATQPDGQSFGIVVRAALKDVVGDSGASAILFYLGELNPETFATKLAAIVGEGAAAIIIQDMEKRRDGEPLPRKHHWFRGRSTRTLPAQDGRGGGRSLGLGFLLPSPLA